MDENNQILKCDFAFKCPQQWENLKPLDHPNKRFCKSCDREVVFVRSRRELAVCRKLGQCIAANVNHPDFSVANEFGGKGLMVGGVAPYLPRADTLNIHMFGETGDVDDLMFVLDEIQRNKQDAN